MMERLTARDKDGLYYPECFECCNGHPEAGACLTCKMEEKIIDRLAYYEDLEEQGRLKARGHHDHNKMYVLGKSIFLTREEAENALKEDS